MGIPSQTEYENSERRRAMLDEQRIERAPLADRREAQADFLAAMASDPATVAERISWIIEGNYGHGQMLMARQVVASPRMNREAALTQLVAVFEWQCPRRMAVEAWKKLTPAQKKALAAAVDVVVRNAEQGEE